MAGEPEVRRDVLDVWPGSADAEAGRWLSALDEIRHGTNNVLDQIDPAAIDADLGDGGDTLGTVIYHIALVEIDWVYSDIAGREADIPRELLPWDDRVEDGKLTPVLGETLAQHRARLDAVRELIVPVITGLSNEDFVRVRDRPWGQVSAAWVLFHLIDHELDHRHRLSQIRDRFRGY